MAQVQSERDIALIFHLWKWRVSTTAVLIAKFFPTVAPATGFRRLWTLQKGGVLKSHVNDCGHKWIWTLGDSGYRAFQEIAGLDLKQAGYRSECKGHDLLASAFHQGDWILKKPDDVIMLSEQQLRRQADEDLAIHIPDIQEWRRRPDGVTYFARTNERLAFETEISLKTKTEYGEIARHYEAIRISDVVWLVKSMQAARKIVREKSGRPPEYHFALIKDFLKRGWECSLYGKKGGPKNVRALLLQKDQNCLKTSSPQVLIQLSLNLSKAPFKSKTCKIYRPGNFGSY